MTPHKRRHLSPLALYFWPLACWHCFIAGLTGATIAQSERRKRQKLPAA